MRLWSRPPRAPHEPRGEDEIGYPSLVADAKEVEAARERLAAEMEDVLHLRERLAAEAAEVREARTRLDEKVLRLQERSSEMPAYARAPDTPEMALAEALRMLQARARRHREQSPGSVDTWSQIDITPT